MKSFVVKLNKFFRMNTGLQYPQNFEETKKSLVIAMYQREYTWTKDKIISLISDISRRDKFIGNVILDEKDNCYEIVDGQQRITTCFLILVCLYNAYSGSPREQSSISSIIESDGRFILRNDSIGNFISKSADHMELDIQDNDDIYCQKGIFTTSYDVIQREIDEISQNNLRYFKEKLLDSEFLVLINDQHTQTNPVEQVFLDINEKAQLLKVEDIFKGHCFKNYDEEHYNELRSTWVALKKHGVYFTKIGFEDLSQYIYLYLLETDSLDISKNTTVDGKHYLDGKDMDQTADLLDQMIQFGAAVSSVLFDVDTITYCFEDLCVNSHEYRTTNDIPTLKRILSELLKYTKAQYQKLPVMYLIYRLKTDENLKNTISHLQFRSIITNLYIYATLFIYSTDKKSKNSIDQTIKERVDAIPVNYSEIVSAAKDLRRAQLDKFSYSLSRNGFEWLSFVYSIMDYYLASQNNLSSVYRRENGFNLEHFIIPDNKQRRITWNDGINSFDFSLDKGFVSKNKKLSINYIILNSTLNEELGHWDIVSKIIKINEWYDARRQTIPNHIRVFIQHIQSMAEYQTLVQLKGNITNHEELKREYQRFLDAFFDTEHTNTLVSRITDEFKSVFQN